MENNNSQQQQHQVPHHTIQVIQQPMGSNGQQGQIIIQGYHPNYQQQQPMVVTTLAPQMPLPNQPIMIIGAPGVALDQVVQPKILGAKKTGYQKLEEQKGIFIKQKMEMLEVITGCETENKYNVYSMNKKGTGKKGHPLFKCKEKSDLCARMCLNGSCRPFKMKISSLVRGEEDDEYEPFLHLERACKFTCLCFDRPEVKVFLVEEGKNEYLGKIVDPWNWCNMEFLVYDKDNNLKFTIEGSCLQLGVWCRFPFEPCQTINFDIKAPSGEVLTTLQKRSPGCLKTMVSDMDNFALNFPEKITPHDKALLMSATLFIDFRHFEENPSKGENSLW